MKRESIINLWYVVFAVVTVLWLRDFWVNARQTESIPYSEFLLQLESGKLQDVQVLDKMVSGTLKQATPEGRKRVISVRVEPELANVLKKSGVRFEGVIESNFLREVLSWVLPALVFFAVWMLLVRRFAEKQGFGGSFLSIGKSKAKVYVETDTKVTFNDVAGVDEAKEELKEVVSFLKNPVEYGRLGARIPKGVLLVGPPGTGKTLLARAVAGEAAVPFFSIGGSEFVEMFVGVGAARVRDLFEQARSKAPAIIFIDELDALGRARGAFGLGGHDEKEQTLNQLLSEIDGFDASKGVVLLAATNRPEILDPALLRAGRFDRQVLVDRPDRVGRVQILAVHLRKVQLASDVDPTKIASLTPGFTGADLANLVNEAALLATRRNAQSVEMGDFSNAVERIVAGLEKKNRILNAQERLVIAHHEMGHALVALSLPDTDPVHKVSIIPRGVGALGYTIQRPTEDRFLMTAPELENKMAVLLGGRAAEALIFSKVSTGAADDLAKVTDIARSMVMRYGMVRELGNVAYEQERPLFLDALRDTVTPRQFGEATAQKIDDAVREIVRRAYDKALTVLTQQRATLEQCAKQLLERETLTEEELRQLCPARPHVAAQHEIA